MARILYGVQGVGNGHSVRSLPVITALRGYGHEVRIAGNDRAYDFYTARGEDVQRLDAVKFALGQQGELQYLKTFARYIETLPKNSIKNFAALKQWVKEFKPDVIITDFEPFTALLAYRHRIPLISVDNQHRITHCKVPVRPRYMHQYMVTKTVIRAFVPHASTYFISSFVPRQLTLWARLRDKAVIIPPIIRSEVEQAVPTVGQAVVTYAWPEHIEQIKTAFKQFPDQPFIIYGAPQARVEGNIILKPFSDDIIADLAAAKAVIGAGGFTFLSEALWLKKPVLSWPQQKQFEQILNAYDIVDAGYGMATDDLSAADIEQFFERLPEFRAKTEAIDFPSSQQTFEHIHQRIESLVKH